MQIVLYNICGVVQCLLCYTMCVVSHNIFCVIQLCYVIQYVLCCIIYVCSTMWVYYMCCVLQLCSTVVLYTMCCVV